MKKKRHIQACELGGSIGEKKRATRKKVSPIHNNISRKDILEVYDRFYRDQLTALYRAVQHGK